MEAVLLEEDGGGGSHHSSYHHYYHGSTSGNVRTVSSVIGSILFYVLFFGIGIFSIIKFRHKISSAKKNSKKEMDILDDKDNAWKYSNIQVQVERAYYEIQNAWAKQDMSSARAYMDDYLYENFQSKLEWMKMKRQKNVLKNISLVKASPVSVYDDKDDSNDFVWYYICGSMVDYTIDLDSQKIIKGNKFKSSFTEYWKFVRKDNDKWVLAEILQSDEEDKIVFQGKKDER